MKKYIIALLVLALPVLGYAAQRTVPWNINTTTNVVWPYGNPDSTVKVGIGTTSPYAKLSVVGETVTSWLSATSTSATSSVFGNFRAGFGTQAPANGGGLTVLNNESSGLVGIGTAAPQSLLHLWNTFTIDHDTKFHYFDGFEYSMKSTVGSGGDYLGFGVYDDGTSSTWGLYSPSTNLLHYLAGNTGIGTSSPYARLSVVGETVSSWFTATSTTASTFTGSIGIATSSPYAKLSVVGTNASLPVLVAKAAVGQTANVMEAQNSANLQVFTVSNAGAVLANSSFTVNNGNGAVAPALSVKRNAQFDAGASSIVALSVFGRSGQTADLVDVRDLTGGSNRYFTVTGNGNVGVGTSTPRAVFQATATSTNATTTIQFGKPSQNKGTCMTYYDTAGSPVYMFIAAGGTTFTAQNGGTAPSGCVN